MQAFVKTSFIFAVVMGILPITAASEVLVRILLSMYYILRVTTNNAMLWHITKVRKDLKNMVTGFLFGSESLYAATKYQSVQPVRETLYFFVTVH